MKCFNLLPKLAFHLFLFYAHGLWARDNSVLYDEEKTRELKEFLTDFSNLSTDEKLKSDEFTPKIKELVGGRADPNAITNRPTKDLSALHLAAEINNVKLIAFLYEHGADIEAKAYFNQTPLYFAAMMGQDDAVAMLLGLGANIHTKDDFDDTPLMRASMGGYCSTIALLVHEGVDIEAKNAQHSTAILFAIEERHTEAIILLLSLGANPMVKNTNDYTALTLAKAIDEKEPIEELSEFLVDFDDPEINDNDIELMAKFTKRSNNDGKAFNQALFFELIRLKKNVLLTTISNYFSSDNINDLVNQFNERGNTPLDIAMISQNLDATRWLLKYGVNIFQSRFNGLYLARHVPALQPLHQEFMSIAVKYFWAANIVAKSNVLPKEIFNSIVKLMLQTISKRILVKKNYSATEL
jgi:ankyrin repeat protein